MIIDIQICEKLYFFTKKKKMEKYIVINVVEDEICLDYMYVHQVLFSLCEVNFKLFKTIRTLTNSGVV